MALTQVDGGLLSPTNGQYTMFKNRIINGAMMIDQRNAGASVSISGAYTLDRWYPSIAGGTGTIQRVAASLSGFGYAAQLVCGTGVTLVSFAQRIESLNCLDLASQTVTLSGYVYIDTVGSATGTVYLATPTSGSPDNWGSGATYLTGQSITLTGGQYTYFSKTFTLPSGASNGVLMDMQFGSAASKTIRITGVQLEKGSTATSFDYRPYGTELALCQRYCYVNGYATGGQAYTRFPVGQNGSTTQGVITFPFPVQMRTIPSLTWNGGFYDIATSGGGATGTSATITSDGNTVTSGTVIFAYSSGTVTNGAISVVRTNNSTSWYARFEAEL